MSRAPDGTVATAALLLVLLSSAADASDSLAIHAFSDVVERGASLSNGNAAVGFSTGYDFSSGWFIGGGGYYADGEPSGSSLTRNLHGHVGYFHSLGTDSALELSLSHAEFIDVGDWSYSEIRGDWHLSRSLAAMLAYSPDYYGRASATNAGITFRPALGERAYLLVSAGLGHVGDDIDETINWAELGGGVSIGRFDLSLTWNAVDSDSARIFATDRDGIALKLSYRLR